MRDRILKELEKVSKLQINLQSKAAREDLADKIIAAIYNYTIDEDGTE